MCAMRSLHPASYQRRVKALKTMLLAGILAGGASLVAHRQGVRSSNSNSNSDA